MPGEAPTSPPIEPCRAIVTPRARCEGSLAVLPLQQLIEPMLAKLKTGTIEIVGPPGSGKSTALAHLAIVLPRDRRIQFFDDPQSDDWHRAASDRISIVASERRTTHRIVATLFLVEWTFDDCMEYLAAVHRSQAASVLVRLREDPSHQFLEGSPRLLRIALDAMAEDQSLRAADALRQHILNQLSDERIRPQTQRSSMHEAWQIEFPEHTPKPFLSLLRHDRVMRVVSSERIARELPTIPDLAAFLERLPRMLVPDLAVALRGLPSARNRIEESLRSPHRAGDATAATLLLAIDPTFRPWSGRPLQLFQAQLARARWSRIDLQDSLLDLAILAGADLDHAVLNRISAVGTDFSRARMRSARLDHCVACNAIFQNADLEQCMAEHANFLGADFTNARVVRANLNNADLGLATLLNTDLSGANLRGANLKGTLTGANFSGSDLTGAKFTHADLRAAIFDGARMVSANLMDCNLENLEIPNANFEGADLGHSYLTGSKMPGANFRGATLSYAGLADIDWEGADLRDAELTASSFHMGSTRCGRVGSDLPCEGSRTGFYTDEFNEQDYKSPEEIRKANLCGADLRGAKVEGVDFYLVDLRGAKYTSKQADHFARCGAILHSRVA